MMRQSGSMRTWTTIIIVLVCCLATRTTGSAIPMWEFLARDEKMSHLYRIFSKQVATYCSDSSFPDCNKNLLINGIRYLANMDENELDRMDPYQRDAKDIIWRAMIGENRLATEYGHEDSYYSTGSDSLATSDNNRLGEESAQVNDYVRPSSQHSGPYLVGPMVIRVFPDGRPVPGDAQRPLPRDEDVDEIKYSKIPSVAEIEASNDTFYYKKSSHEGPTKKLNAYIHNNPAQRPNLIPISKNSHYLAVNPLFRERRNPPKISNVPRFIPGYQKRSI